jgi:hypothetical protein
MKHDADYSVVYSANAVNVSYESCELYHGLCIHLAMMQVISGILLADDLEIKRSRHFSAILSDMTSVRSTMCPCGAKQISSRAGGQQQRSSVRHQYMYDLLQEHNNY